ncbi:MAG: aroK [Gemmatimonadetes bacterium]|nr:aroK [Gemmatimonadota bacterium]
MATFRTSQPGSAADSSKPHIILVGLPGAGKTTVGKIVARLLGRSFLDFDLEISRREGMTITEIFAVRGEPVFRQLERSLTEEVALFGNMVLAPGGGWVSQADIVALLRPNATMVYLFVPPALALKRMGQKTAGRPLLQRPNPRGELERLLEVRRVVYESADHVLSVERLDPQRVAEKVVALVKT